jgi:hypothetical protein
MAKVFMCEDKKKAVKRGTFLEKMQLVYILHIQVPEISLIQPSSFNN